MSKVLIYRPSGEHPPGTKMGDLLLGKVHEVKEADAEVYARKGFVKMPAEAKTADAKTLAAMYESAKRDADREAVIAAPSRMSEVAPSVTASGTGYGDSAPVLISGGGGATDIATASSTETSRRSKDRG